jgi:hypothetical protein
MALTNYPLFGDNRIPFDVSRLNENRKFREIEIKLENIA